MYKNIWSVFNKDTGEITMSNQVFEDPNGDYGKILSEREMSFVNNAGSSYARLDRHFVWNGNLSDRPRLPLKVNKGSMSIKDKSPIVVTNIPKDANVRIRLAGIDRPLADQVIGDASLALETTVPGEYEVTISKWPYRDAVRTFRVMP